MSRKRIVAGNWKMNCNLSQANELISQLQMRDIPESISVFIAPPYTNLHSASLALKETKIEVIAQNMHQVDKGAFTGEISASMLKSVGVNSVILGHSERRAYFLETNQILASKVKQALVNNMKLFFCFGEELEDRKVLEHFKVVEEQLQEGLFHISKKDWANVVLAYEPVWAIGTGETATPEQAQEMHQFVRNIIMDAYGNEIADKVSILYGGSVKSNNAKDIFAKPDVDGGLVGGASLQPEAFLSIINSF